jgi:hypothetical protein
MQLNLKKIDERISKLQEIKRIASDPELVSMLFEFIATEEQAKVDPAALPKADTGVAARMDDSELVNQVVKGIDGQESGLWSRRRG